MSEFLFETAANFIETFIMTDFVTKYLEPKFKGGKRILGFVLCWFAVFFQVCIMNKITDFEMLGTYIPILIYYVYSCFFLNGTIGLKLWIALFIELIVYIIALITNLAICHIITYEPADMITVFNSTRIIGVIITKVILFYTTRIILRNKYKYPLDKYKWIMLVFIPVISLISLGALMKIAIYDTEMKLYVFLGMSCIVIANIVTYLFFVIMNKEYENAVKSRLLKQQNETLKQNIADQDAFVKEMKSVRHDIKNQFLTILKYADENRCDDIKEYVNTLTNNYMPNVLNYINTENMAFDAIINSKIAVSNQYDVFMEVVVRQNADIALPPTEIAVLFGNLLDNAIEAAKKTNEKRISVEIQKSANYLIIVISNSIKTSVLKENSALETSKKDKKLHGIGIGSVKNIVKKHNGMIQFYEEENEFFCHIMLELNM